MATVESKQPETFQPIKVALWCTPRSSSTAFTRCLSGIPGIKVHLELYAYVKMFRNTFLMTTGKELPMEVTGNEDVYEEANALWEKTTGFNLKQEFMSFPGVKQELQSATDQFVLLKDMAINSIEPMYLPSDYKHVFLIRDPSRVFASARKVSGRKYAELGMIPSKENYDLVRDDPMDSQPMKWFELQHTMWTYVREHIDPNPVIVDWSDLLSNSAPVLRAFCDAVGFPYSGDLLHWTAATELPPNFVTAGENVFDEMFMFYEKAFKSTHFISPDNVRPIPRDELTDDVIRCVDYSMPFYSDMFAHRLHST